MGIHLDPLRLVALSTLCGLAGAQDRATLVHRPDPAADVMLPAEPWRNVDGPIELRGASFATDAAETGVLGLDTDGDGTIDSRLSGRGGRVVLTGLEHPSTSDRPLPLSEGPLSQEAPEPPIPFTHVAELRRRANGWQWRSSGCLVARVRGQVLRLYDLDGNASFADFGTDALAIGEHPAATLLSRVIHLNGSLVRLEVLDGAREVRIEPFEGLTGRVDAKSDFSSKGRLVAAIVQDGDLSFDLAAGQGELELPVGNYRLVSGIAAKGEESVRIRAGRMNPVRVDADTPTTLPWGGPLEAEFEYRVDDSTIVVEPEVSYFGRAGEEYYAFWPCAQSPHVSVVNRETGDKVQSGYFGGSCGGGLSRFQATVPSGVPLEVVIDHERALFGKIQGSSDDATSQANR